MMATTTTPTLSGLLRVSNTDAQISSGCSAYRLRFDYRETRELANWMGFFNSGESPESANQLISSTPCVAGEDEHEQYSGLIKPENYSGSAEHKHYLGSLVIHCGCTYENQHPTGKEKGRTANPTLWDDCFYNHEENHEYPVLEDAKSCGANRPSFRGAVHYESSVVHISTYTKSVGQSSCDSLAFLRCLRLISPCSAATTNCPVLSLSSLSVSTASATSWGTRTSKRLDLALMPLVAMVFSIVTWCPTSYSIQIVIESIDVSDTMMLLCVRHLISMILVSAKPSSATNTYQASIHNVTKAYTMEYSHSTQTRPEKKYLWRFLALNRSDMCAKPCRISVEAPTEHDARRVLAPFFILSLSARLSAQGVCNV